jgi:hypothetical protein
MRVKTKIVIFLAAVVVTFLGFNFITCSGGFCKLLKAGQEWTVMAAAGCQGAPDAVVTASTKL